MKITEDFMPDRYCIREGYKCRSSVSHFDDRGNADRWQDEVYATARRVADEMGARKILDIGTGSGFKLIKYFSDLDTVGLELEPALSYLKEEYPDRKWEESNIESPEKHGDFDVLICSDVIEHIENPDDLMKFISGIGWRALVISTPARELLASKYGSPESGPPNNPCHYREWTTDEFVEYLSRFVKVSKLIHGDGMSVNLTVIAGKK